MDTVAGKTIGFVGFGHIAQMTAKLAKDGFGMRVAALRRTPTKGDEHGLADVTFGHDQKLQLFAESDYVVCVLPGTPETLDFCGGADSPPPHTHTQIPTHSKTKKRNT